MMLSSASESEGPAEAHGEPTPRPVPGATPGPSMARGIGVQTSTRVQTAPRAAADEVAYHLVPVLEAGAEAGDGEVFPRQLRLAAEHIPDWNVNADVGEGRCLLHHACALPPTSHHGAWVDCLLSAGARVDTSDHEGSPSR